MFLKSARAWAIALISEDTAAFRADLLAHLTRVEKHYAQLFEEAPQLGGPGNLVFTGTNDDPATIETLSRMGYAEPAAVAATVRGPPMKPPAARVQDS